MLEMLLVEDSERLRPALKIGLEGTGTVRVVHSCGSGEDALAFCLSQRPDVILDDAYFRAFRHSGVLSHYAYVRKSNYLLPQMIVPLLEDTVSGHSFIDPEIECRVQEVRHKDEQSPMALLEPNEQAVALMLAQGMSNEQIAARMGFRDKRTISRTNGQIYAVWGLVDNATDEKVARTRAAVIVREGRMMRWDESGVPHVLDNSGRWVAYEPDSGRLS